MRNQRNSRTNNRVLALHPSSRGFGYVVFEGPERLIDWGVPYMHGGNKHARCLKRIDGLVTLYDPDVAVLEDTSSGGCRRGANTRKLIAAVQALLDGRGVPVKLVPRTTMLRVFADVGCANKDDIAAHIATRHPELEPRVPPRRKCWMAEDWRINMFDAAAYAHTFFSRNESSRTAPRKAA